MYETINRINRYLDKQEEKYFYERHRYMVRRFGYDPEIDVLKNIEPTCF